MKLSATNKKCLIALEARLLKSVAKGLHDKAVEAHEPKPGKARIGYFFDDFKQQRVIKISNKFYESAMLVSVESLSDLIELETRHRDIVILYPFEKMAYVRKIGKEVAFLVVDFQAENVRSVWGNYNFISAEFYPNDDIEDKKELLQILIYLFHGDIEQKFVDPKKKLKKSSLLYILNDSSTGVFFADCLWKQRINVSGFKVRGHFRLQPHGEGMAKRKLIWIEEFAKKGYRRRATREVCEDITPPKK